MVGEGVGEGGEEVVPYVKILEDRQEGGQAGRQAGEGEAPQVQALWYHYVAQLQALHLKLMV